MIKKNEKNIDVDNIKSEIDIENLPKHVAIIMDGNGRWAKKRFLPRTAGHREGVERVKEIVETVGNLGIKHLTLYAFSTENWNRPRDEVDTLMKLLVEYLKRELDTLNRNNVRIKVLGDISKIPELPRQLINSAIEQTRNNKKLILNIALNYGGRNEIITAVKNIINDFKYRDLNTDLIDEETFKNYLFTKEQPDPDLIIRTSGELRISNFLLYQAAYAELWFTEVLWPDFRAKDFYQAIVDYQKRKRRFGGI